MSPVLPQDVPSRAHDLIVTCITCCTLTTVFLSVRMYTRIVVNRTVGWDDYAALATYPFIITYCVLTGISTQYGMGLHASAFTEGLREQYQKWIFIGSFTWLFSLLGYKMSILLLYLRIFNVNRTFRYSTFGVMFIVFSYLFSNFWTQLFGCNPIRKAWATQTPGHCIATINSDYAYGSLNWISDIIIFCLPLPIVWHLKLGKKEKLGLCITFMLGSMQVSSSLFKSIKGFADLLLSNWIVAIVRFTYVLKDLTAVDRPWIAAETFLWSVIEINTGLMCGCVPVLKPFFLRTIPNGFTERSWSFGRSKHSWDSDTSQGHTHIRDKSYIELEHNKTRNYITSVSADARQSQMLERGPTNGRKTGLHGDHLDDRKYIIPY